jgi:hypothetical protein
LSALAGEDHPGKLGAVQKIRSSKVVVAAAQIAENAGSIHLDTHR